jgi:archaellum component FlaC
MEADTKEQFDKLNARFDNIENRFGSLQNFMMEHLVTKQELEAVVQELPTKADFQNLMTTVDGYAKQAKYISEEILILGEKANRLELWAKSVSTKLGVEYNP